MAVQIKQYSPKDAFIKAVIYGASGSGKTSFGGTAEKVIFASAEGGLLSIADKNPDYVAIKSLEDLRAMHAELLKGGHGYETVIIDSITEINELIKVGIEKKLGRSMQLNDWGVLAKNIKETLRNFRDLPMNVVFIAQEMQDEKDENGKATKIVPSLNGKASTEIAYFMDIVGYMFITPQGEHKILTAPHPRYLTKDRSKMIGNETTPDFSVWVEKIKGLKVGAEKVVKTITEDAPPAPKKKSATYTATVAKLKTLTDATQIEEASLKVSNSEKFTEEEKTEFEAEVAKHLETLSKQSVI